MKHLKQNLPSDERSIDYGVPQGSTLGPVLFLLYINDLEFACRYSKILLFADDTNLFLTGSSLEDMIREINCDLMFISRWLVSNRLTLNLGKTHYLIFSGPRTHRKRFDSHYPFLGYDNLKSL